MHLVSARVSPFKSIESPRDVKIENGVTVLVGMNEAGKTVFLQALQKSDDIFGMEQFNYIDDYPRRHLHIYEKRHDTTPDAAVVLTYQLRKKETEKLNAKLGTQLPEDFQFTVTHDYKNKITVDLTIDHAPVLSELSKTADLSTEFRDAVKNSRRLEGVPDEVEGLSLTDADKECLALVNTRIAAAKKK